MAEEIDPVNQRVAELLSFGVPEQDIVSHLSQSKEEPHKLWVQKWKSAQTAERAAQRIPPTEPPVTTELQRLQKLAEENPITTAAAATAATATAGLGTYAIKSRMDTAAKIREAKALAKLEPSEAVKIQREQLDLAKQKFQAEQNTLIANENKAAINTGKLNAYSIDKHGFPLSTLEEASGGRLTKPSDIDIVAQQLKAGRGLSVNPIPGTVSNQPSGVPGVNPMDKLTVQPPAPQLIQPKPPAGAVAPGVAPIQPTLKQAVESGADIGQALKADVAGMVDQAGGVVPPAELRTGTGKIAYAGTGPEPTIGKKGPQFKKEYQSLEHVPQGYAFVPGAQYADPLRQDLGQFEYTKAFTGRDFPQTYEEAISTGKDINRSLGRATREEAKAAGLPKAETTKGIFKTTTENKKLVNIIGKAGMAGALVSLADLALAKTPQEKTNAGLGLLGAILPPGMDINAAGAPGLPQSQVNNSYLLGSPFAQTQAAKDFRNSQKVGAGRGIAPPSAYQR